MGYSRRQILSWVSVGGLIGVSGCSQLLEAPQKKDDEEQVSGQEIVASQPHTEERSQGRFFVTLGGSGSALSVNEKAGLRVASVTLARDTPQRACPDWNIIIKVVNTTSDRIELESLSIELLDWTGRTVVSQQFDAQESTGEGEGDIPVEVEAGSIVVGTTPLAASGCYQEGRFQGYRLTQVQRNP